MANEHNELCEHNSPCVNYALGYFVGKIEDSLKSRDESEVRWIYDMFNNGTSLAEYVVNMANEYLTTGEIACRCNLDGYEWTNREVRVVAKGEAFSLFNANPDVTGRI